MNSSAYGYSHGLWGWTYKALPDPPPGYSAWRLQWFPIQPPGGVGDQEPTVLPPDLHCSGQSSKKYYQAWLKTPQGLRESEAVTRFFIERPSPNSPPSFISLRFLREILTRGTKLHELFFYYRLVKPQDTRTPQPIPPDMTAIQLMTIAWLRASRIANAQDISTALSTIFRYDEEHIPLENGMKLCRPVLKNWLDVLDMVKEVFLSQRDLADPDFSPHTTPTDNSCPEFLKLYTRGPDSEDKILSDLYSIDYDMEDYHDLLDQLGLPY